MGGRFVVPGSDDLLHRRGHTKHCSIRGEDGALIERTRKNERARGHCSTIPLAWLVSSHCLRLFCFCFAFSCCHMISFGVFFRSFASRVHSAYIGSLIKIELRIILVRITCQNNFSSIIQVGSVCGQFQRVSCLNNDMQSPADGQFTVLSFSASLMLIRRPEVWKVWWGSDEIRTKNFDSRCTR